ncbi:spirocyclase AveC family protein [Actinomadura harenae]|uniref:spirocyclase AveC family protein n=1 Tax=Actinomadura harenae TaxID=2483351 RepID=UPI0013157A3C|nr:spirocyclase AveC family protein [Actinomadura harenae]
MFRWAVAGATGLTAGLVLILRWLLDGGWRLDRRPPTHPGLGSPSLTTWFTPCYALVVLGILTVVIWDCRRRHRLTYPAAVMIVAIPCMWMDSLGAYARPVFGFYKDHPWAIRSWSAYLPGWHGGDQPATDLPVQALMYYLSMPLLFFVVRQATRLSGRARPSWGRYRLTAVAIAAAALCSAAVMLLGISVRLFAYLRVIPSLTVFYGTRFQYPAYDAIYFGVAFAWFGLLWQRLDADGLTAVERGAERFPRRSRPWIRCLAIAGALQAALLFYGLATVATSFATSGPPAQLRTPILTSQGWFRSRPSATFLDGSGNTRVGGRSVMVGLRNAEGPAALSGNVLRGASVLPPLHGDGDRAGPGAVWRARPRVQQPLCPALVGGDCQTILRLQGWVRAAVPGRAPPHPAPGAREKHARTPQDPHRRRGGDRGPRPGRRPRPRGRGDMAGQGRLRPGGQRLPAARRRVRPAEGGALAEQRRVRPGGRRLLAALRRVTIPGRAPAL